MSEGTVKPSQTMRIVAAAAIVAPIKAEEPKIGTSAHAAMIAEKRDAARKTRRPGSPGSNG